MAVAVAVAGAFVVGALAPFSLWTRSSSTNSSPVVVSPSVPPVVAAESARTADCVSGASVGPGAALGHIDEAHVGGDSVRPDALKVVPHVGVIELIGWIVDPDGGVGGGICVLVDGHPITSVAKYGLDRPDVAAALGRPDDRATGVDVRFTLPPGSHAVTLGVVEPGGTIIHALNPPLQVVSS